MALWFALYGLETLAEALLLTAVDAPTFWTAYRGSRVFLAFLQPLSVLVPAIIAGLRWKAVLVLVGPLALGSIVEAVLAVFGPSLVVGFRIGPWATVAIPDPNSGAVWWVSALGAYTAIANLAVLAWAWVRHPARPYREFLLRYLTLNAVAIAATGICLALWAIAGVPDVSFVFGVIYLVGLLGLLSRYPFLSDHRPLVDLYLLHSLKTALFVLDGRGRVLHASQGAASLLGRLETTLERKSLTELLGPWPGLTELEGVRDHGRVPTQPLEGSLGSNRFRLTLTPSLDRFGHVRALYARLDPVDALDWLGQQFGVSPREKEVAALVVEGMGTQQIADLLFISVATVKNHLHRVFEKTGTTSRMELVRLIGRGD